MQRQDLVMEMDTSVERLALLVLMVVACAAQDLAHASPLQRADISAIAVLERGILKRRGHQDR